MPLYRSSQSYRLGSKTPDQKRVVSRPTEIEVEVSPANPTLAKHQAAQYNRIEDDELYDLTPSYKARSQQRRLPSLSQDVAANPTAPAAEREQDSYATDISRVPDSQAAPAASATAPSNSQLKRTPSNLGALANGALSQADLQTPAVPEAGSTSALRAATQTSALPAISSHTTIAPSTGKVLERELDTLDMSAAAKLREKKARESGASVDLEADTANPHVKAPASTTAKASTAATIHNQARKSRAENDVSVQAQSKSGPSQSKVRDPPGAGNQGDKVPKQVATEKAKSKSQPAPSKPLATSARATNSSVPAARNVPAANRSQKPVNDDHNNESDEEPVQRKRGRPKKNTDNSSSDIFELPVSPAQAAKTTTRTTRAAAKTKQPAGTAIKQEKEAPVTRKNAPRKAKLASSDQPKAPTPEPEQQAKPSKKKTRGLEKPPAPPANGALHSKKPEFKDREEPPPSQGTQKQPLVLSDDDESSSPLVPSPEKPAQAEEPVAEAKVAKKIPVRLDDTPRNMRSSPPAVPRTAAKQQAQDSVQHTDRKPTIAAFDKSGPRNQGARPDPSSVRTARTSLPLGNAGEGRRTKGASSVATSMRTTRSAIAKPSNIANNVGDALAGFTTGRRSAQASTDRVQYADPSPAAVVQNDSDEVPAQAPDVDDEPMPVQAQDERTDDATASSKVDSAKPMVIDRSVVQRTASQLAMPPPTRKQKEQQAPVVPAMRHELSERNETEKHSATPMPEVKQATRSARPRRGGEEAEPLHSAVVQKKQPRPDQQSQSVAAGKKRALDDSDVPATVGDRKRAKVDNEPVASQAAASSKALKAHPTTTASQSHTNTSPKRKPHVTLDAPISKPDAAARRAAKRDIRQRQASQGSQTVDVNGSPVPLDMDVPQKSTVLDAYTERPRAVPVTSNSISNTVVKDKFRPAVVGDDFVPPPSNQSKPPASNKKRRPVSPTLDSETISTVKLTAAQSRSLLEKERSFSKLADPFELSATGNRGKADDSSTSPVAAFTKAIGRSSFRTRSATAQASQALTESEAASSPENDRILAQDLTEQIEDLNDSTAFVRADSDIDEEEHDTSLGEKGQPGTQPTFQVEAEETRRGYRSHHANANEDYDDTEMTLVDEVEKARPTQRLHQRPDGKPAKQGFLQTGSTRKSPEQQEALMKEPLFEPLSDDLMSWCHDLKPHQLSLFDEVVKCGRRIVEYFVEMEDGVANTLTLLHKRQLRMLRDEEQHRAKRYDQLQAELKSQKRETEKNLRRRQRAMQEGLERLHEKKERQQQEADTREMENEKLEAWLDKLS